MTDAPSRTPVQKLPAQPAKTSGPLPHQGASGWEINVDGQLPPNFVAVPLWGQAGIAPLKICVVCCKSPEPGQQHLMYRRDLLDAKVYLGCLVDAVGVMEFLEIWVQSLDGLTEAAKSQILCGAAINNTTLDRRWHGMVDAGLTSWPGAMVACGFEKENPPPTFISFTNQPLPVHPEGWRLCRDDAVLATAGLPPFSTTRDRYLVKRSESGNRFVPLFPDSPRNPTTVEYETVLPDFKKLIPLNPAAGLLSVRRAGNLRLAEFCSIAAGKRFTGAVYGRTRFTAGPLRSLNSPNAGMFFPGEPQTNPGRFVETYLVKMSLLAGMIDEVCRFTTNTQRPLLNLKPASFIVAMNDTGPIVPAMWTARPALVDSGDAVPISFPQGNTNFQYFLPGKSVQSSIYQPGAVARGTIDGFAQCYLSGSSEVENGASKVFDGMLTLVDPIRPTRNDIFRVRLRAGDQRVDLYVRVDPNAGPSPAVLKFRSVPDARINPHEAAIPIGVPQDVSFEYYPLFSSGCDVYSLAVIAVEILLTPAANSGVAGAVPVTHAEQLRDVLSLATRCRETYKADQPLDARIKAIFAERPEWAKKLGPQCLISNAINPEAAFRMMTPELWWSSLAFIIKMLPGHGPDSYLTNLGDMVDDRIEKTYATLAKDLDALLQRTRSLIFGEWGVNRELGSILNDLAESLNPPKR